MKRFLITSGMTPDPANAISDLGEVNMGDPDTLVNFVQWGITQYPATNYASVLWNHGGGWRGAETLEESLVFKDVCSDDTSGDILCMDEVQTALDAILSLVETIHLIGFDACLMAMVEVAYEIYEYGLVMVGSENTVPWDGWPYDTILSDLKANPGWTAAQLGTDIVDRYYQSYGNGETLSAIDLSRMNLLATTTSSFAQTMRDSWNTDPDAVKTVAQLVMNELDTAVIHEHHSSSRPDSRGLAMYFPEAQAEFDSDYNGTTIDFRADTVWEEFLADFYASMGGSWIDVARWLSQEYERDVHIDLYDFCQELVNYTPCSTQYYAESLVGHEFIGSGEAQGWNDDEESWLHSLPFSFPFFGDSYSSVYVCSNGYLDFSDPSADWNNSRGELVGRVMIAPLWVDLVTDGTSQSGEDIYIHQPTPDSVCIRWRAETWSFPPFIYPVNVNLEVILYEDGRIRFNYGSGNTFPGFLIATIGISKGDSSCFDLSEYDGYSNLENVDSDLFTPIAEELEAEAGGPYFGIVDGDIFISGSASGGTPPYTYAWDLDNDGDYDDALGADITHSWSTADSYTIGLQVTDSALATATDTATVEVAEWDPWDYDADEDGVMEITKVLTAISEYFATEITIIQVLQVISLYFSG